jgi:hypothetical protein
MTFAELIAMVRAEIIVDEYDDAFDDDDIRDALWNASVYISSAFDFPRALETVALTANDITITPPENCGKVVGLSVNGDDARSADIHHVYRMRAPGPGPVKFFNFDPRRPGAEIAIAPASLGGTALIECTMRLERPDALSFDDAEPWLGALSAFHAMIAYRAATALFQMDERENETEYWRQEYQHRAVELSAFLGRTDMANLTVEQALRNDEGAEE